MWDKLLSEKEYIESLRNSCTMAWYLYLGELAEYENNSFINYWVSMRNEAQRKEICNIEYNILKEVLKFEPSRFESLATIMFAWSRAPRSEIPEILKNMIRAIGYLHVDTHAYKVWMNIYKKLIRIEQNNLY